MPRTGVRLLAAILDAHPVFASGPELSFMITMAHQWRDIEHTLGDNHNNHYGVSREATRAAFRTSMLKFFAPRLAATAKKRFVFHSFGAAISLNIFAALFPNARFILTLRDPRDVARSLLQCDWRNPRDGQPLPYTRDAAAGARLWLDFMQLALQSTPALEADGRLLMLRYEDFCSRPHEAMLRLGQFLEQSPPEPTVGADAATLVTLSADVLHPPLRVGGVEAHRVALWRTSMHARDVAAVERITTPLRNRFGYS